MQTGMNVALSGQIVLQRKLETIAHNIANANTPGFRAREITFDSILAQTGDNETAFRLRRGIHVACAAAACSRPTMRLMSACSATLDRHSHA